MATANKKETDTKPNTATTADVATAQSGAAVTSPASAAGESAPAVVVKEDVTKRRFKITASEESGAVKTFAGIEIVNGVGYCDVPATAWHCKVAGYDVTDALTGKAYDGSKPAEKPANG